MTKLNKLPAVVFGVILSLVTGSAVNADDTDIYTNNTNVAGTPLVMFTLDYRSSNLNSTACGGTECDFLVSGGYLASTPTTRLGLLKATLKKVLENLGGMKIGLMVTHDHGSNCAGPSDTQCSNGAYVVSGLSSITTSSTDANKLAFYNQLDQFASGVSGSASHSYQGKEIFFEFFRYLSGQGVYNAHLGFKDFGDNNRNTNLDADFPSLKRDMNIESDADGDYDTPGTYATPIDDDCQKIFTINFAFGVSQQDSDSDSAITASKGSGGLDGINLSGRYNKVETVLEYMHQTDFGDGSWGTAPNKEGKQNVTSFFVMDSSGLNTGNDWAVAGGTTAAYEWGNDPEALVESLTSIFSQILSVSTTFTAASVPVSVLNRAQVIDNVYIALFRADPNGLKRWPGNVKRLKLDIDNTGSLVDVNDTPAVAIDGRIKNTALTFWTDANNLPTPDTSNDEIAGKDGRAVKRGGAGHKIPGFITDSPSTTNSSGRKLYYQNGTGTAAFNNLNADSTTATALVSNLGAADATEAEVLLQYARGLDVNDEDGDSSSTDARPWMLGDPLHSRPLPINYGARTGYSATNPDIRLYMGANDGFMHAFTNSNTGGSALGEEAWAYMPLAVMPIVKQLKENTAGTHPYGVDGAPATYIEDTDNDGILESSEKAWLYFGLRRGGRGMYGLNVTDPDSPSQLWAITNASTGFSKLGYTFSTPRTGKMDWGSGVKPVVMFAGGYDMNKDSNRTDDSYGNAFYVVDAQTGALVWKAEGGASTASGGATSYTHVNMDDSIPSPVTAVDTDGNGTIDRAYVGDTGGRVWRIDMAGTDRTAWKISELASIGRHYNNAPASDRRFFHRPDFIQYKDSTGAYDAVVIASGDRANPLDTTPENWVYMIKDRATTSGVFSASALSHTSFGDVTNNCLQDNSCGGSPPSLTNGWKLQLELGGEKALATPTTLARTIFVTTYIPPGSGSSGSCEPDEGTGRLYALNLDDATAKNDYSVANGDDLEKEDRHTDLASGGIPAEVVYVPFDRVLKPDLSLETVNTTGRWKTYWYKEEN